VATLKSTGRCLDEPVSAGQTMFNELAFDLLTIAINVGVLALNVKLYTEIVKYRVLDPTRRRNAKNA
jgi:hypothetical protein